ncbi:MAG TPA: aminotransferase class V-fold PLP-dependent enzyme [Planctomycetota bacterium]|nr:aminotransferase class V-fold PLP-dependent enzyme [Planctomycetota bacterium]
MNPPPPRALQCAPVIYLDHAATSFPKPAPVLAAVEHWFRELGVSEARGASRRCAEVAQEVRAARGGVGALLGLPAERVAFTSGATESLNLFLRAFLRHGDTVLTTAFEHSSVVRPLVALRAELGLRLEVLAPDHDGGLRPERVRAALQGLRPRLFAFTHASNVTGAVLDAAAFCELARAQACTTLLDGSQTIGAIDLVVGADAVAASCHKALHAPPGLGFLAVRPGIDLRPQKQGGTGSSRALAEHPQQWPLAFEAGTPNTPAILGLAAALRWLEQEGRDLLRARSLQRTDELIAGLAGNDRYRLLLPPPGPRLPILSLLADHDPAELGAILDDHEVHVRTGYHCAPWLHPHLGSEAAGTVRLSPGPQVSAADIHATLAVLAG